MAETLDDLLAPLYERLGTWQAVADRIGLTTRQLLNLRAGGGRRRPNPLTLKALAGALRCGERRVLAAIKARASRS